MFFLKKIQQRCSLIGKSLRFVFLFFCFSLAGRSSDTLDHFKVFPENEEQQPCQERLLSRQS